MTQSTTCAIRALPAIAVFICSALLGVSCASAAWAEPKLGSCEREMARAAQAEDVPLAVLYSVGLTETGARGQLQPYAMNVDGVAVFSASLPEAMAKFDAAKARGAKFIDIGCMQINHRFHGKNFASLAAMFDERLNVAYAARFLKELRAREPSWTLAVARYNAGPDNNYAQKKYVCAVISSMVRSGFGGWTDNARRFCAPGGA
ncbi:hypothetical protein GGD83_003160 [Rhodoblastus sphagnicola]|nr:transglycosylase SLT domain-containing protein [Rhodoblastus sphagnicola]MBB4199345.1 hypothetical protein [Rhodoblastus sphagnicola]